MDVRSKLLFYIFRIVDFYMKHATIGSCELRTTTPSSAILFTYVGSIASCVVQYVP